MGHSRRLMKKNILAPANSHLTPFASQLDYLDAVSDSGATRFQSYRASKVLAVGSGPLLISLVAAMLESGLFKLHLMITDRIHTDLMQLETCLALARNRDSKLEMEVHPQPVERGITWREALRPFDAIVYVSQDEEVSELRAIHAACREEEKLFLPALYLHHWGIAGPLVHAESAACWESAWRRLHGTVLARTTERQAYSATAGMMLANVIVYELFNKITGITGRELNYQLYLLDLKTLASSRHSFLPHPLVADHQEFVRIRPYSAELALMESETFADEELLTLFSDLTSEISGVFHIWDEEDLKQLPLAQCRVQAADPLSAGPAELLPDIVCAGLSHVEARREAGLTGLESYIMRLHRATEVDGIGIGFTAREGIVRGLRQSLLKSLRQHCEIQHPAVTRIILEEIEDEPCQYYWHSLTLMGCEPRLGLGEALWGFPVIWISSQEQWYGTVGLNLTLALRQALLLVLQRVQNIDRLAREPYSAISSAIMERPNGHIQTGINIPFSEEESSADVFRGALNMLKHNRMELLAFEWEADFSLQKEFAGPYGICLREASSLEIPSYAGTCHERFPARRED